MADGIACFSFCVKPQLKLTCTMNFFFLALTSNQGTLCIANSSPLQEFRVPPIDEIIDDGNHNPFLLATCMCTVYIG